MLRGGAEVSTFAEHGHVVGDSKPWKVCKRSSMQRTSPSQCYIVSDYATLKSVLYQLEPWKKKVSIITPSHPYQTITTRVEIIHMRRSEIAAYSVKYTGFPIVNSRAGKKLQAPIKKVVRFPSTCPKPQVTMYTSKISFVLNIIGVVDI
jgi:hypothetical protein